MNYSSHIAKRLLQINAIKLSPQNPFTWASGIKSPIYCDNRLTLSYPDVRKEIVTAFVELTSSFDFEVIAGVATAGIPHGALLAYELNQPFIYVRSKAKEHGRKNQIEGKLEANQKVLVVEDLISTGGSSLKAVDALREAGAEVMGVIAIFSYSFDKAQQAFEAANCPFATLSNYEALLNVAIQQKYISQDDYATLRAWRASPETWNK